MEIHILVNGIREKLKDMVYTLGSMATDTKANFDNVWNTVKESRNSVTEIYTRETTRMESLQGMDNTIGPTEVILKDSLKMGWEMDKESGKKDLEIVINTKDSMQMIKNVVTEFLHGPLVTSTKGITSQIKDTALDKCTGVTEVSTKETGIKGFSMEKVIIISN